jgi:predicted transcriptional regulator
MGYKQLIFETSIKGIKVKDIMNKDIVSISKDLTLDNLVNNYFMKYRYGRFPVVKGIDEEEVIGVISIHDIKTVSRDQWSATKVGDIVKSISKNEIINMDMEVADAIRKMSSNNLGHLVVMTGNKLIGLITKSDVMKFVKIRSELH